MAMYKRAFGALLGVAVAVLVLLPSAAANPVAVTYVDVPLQCVDPPNVGLTDEVGGVVFPPPELISYTVGPAVTGDCTIPVGGGDDYLVTATNTTGRCLTTVFVVADAGVTFDNWDGMIAGQRAKKINLGVQGQFDWLPGQVLSFELLNVAPNAPPNFDSLGVPSAALPSNFSIVANPCAGGLVKPPPDKFAPDWWNNAPPGMPFAFGMWDTFEVYPEIPEEFASSYLGEKAFTLTISGSTVSMLLDNVLIPENSKELFIYVEGTGAGLPTNLAIQPAPPAYSGIMQTVPPQLPGSTWAVWVYGRITPQPDAVTFAFTLPAGGAVTQAWAGDYCHDSDIPAVSEWGLVVMLLLVAAAGTIVVTRARARALSA